MTGTALTEPRLKLTKDIAEKFKLDKSSWSLIVDVIYPAAETTEIIVTALSYCLTNKMNILQRPINIVPVWDSKRKQRVQTIWEGIATFRIRASRTGVYAGKDDMLFGKTITEEFTGKKGKFTTTYPEWAQCVVYKIVQGVRCPFYGEKVRFKEIYATERNDSTAPNRMWAKSSFQQMTKCAEANALRIAFPEALGSSYTDDEMRGKVVATTGAAVAAASAAAITTNDQTSLAETITAGTKLLEPNPSTPPTPIAAPAAATAPVAPPVPALDMPPIPPELDRREDTTAPPVEGGPPPLPAGAEPTPTPVAPLNEADIVKGILKHLAECKLVPQLIELIDKVNARVPQYLQEGAMLAENTEILKKAFEAANLRLKTGTNLSPKICV